MIGDLAAAVDLHYGNIIAYEQMLGFAGEALGEHGWMLHHPQFIFGGFVARVVKCFHGFKHGRVIGQAQLHGFHV